MLKLAFILRFKEFIKERPEVAYGVGCLLFAVIFAVAICIYTGSASWEQVVEMGELAKKWVEGFPLEK